MKLLKAILITAFCFILGFTMIHLVDSATAEYDNVTITGYVRVSSGSYLNVREKASDNSKIIGKLYLNDPVEIVETVGKWYKINYLDSYAYVHSDYIKDEPLVIFYDDVPTSELRNDNIPNLQVRYVGYLAEKTGAYPMKSTKRSCYIPAGPIPLGDIVISIERAKEQAEEYGHSYKRELHYLFVHGIMHCLGYDHIEEEDKKVMRAREEEILTKLKLTRED